MKKSNFLLIISREKAIFANQNDIPANRSQKPAKTLANQKGGCCLSYPVMPNTILYFCVYIECLLLPLMEVNKHSFFISNITTSRNCGRRFLELCEQNMRRKNRTIAAIATFGKIIVQGAALEKKIVIILFLFRSNARVSVMVVHTGVTRFVLGGVPSGLCES
ncbi:MAG: hypothetical protein ACLRPB_06880 [Lawsonibacter sp.]